MNNTRHQLGAGGTTEAYTAPTITDLGGLVALTRSASLFFGHTQVHNDLSMSGVTSGGGSTPTAGTTPPGGTTVTPVTPISTVTPTPVHHVTTVTPVHHAAGGTSHHGSSGTSHHGSSGTSHHSSGTPTNHGSSTPKTGTTSPTFVSLKTTGTGSTGGHLPFTGYPLVMVGAVGAAFSALGAGIRRALSRSR